MLRSVNDSDEHILIKSGVRLPVVIGGLVMGFSSIGVGIVEPQFFMGLLGVFFTVMSIWAASIRIEVTKTHFIVRSTFKNKPIHYFQLDRCEVSYYWSRRMWIFCEARIWCGTDMYRLMGLGIKRYGRILDIIEERGKVI